MIGWRRVFIVFLIIGGLLMALHDVDKKNDDRTAPVVASQDKVPSDARLSHGTTQVSNKDEGADPNGSVQVQESLIKSVDSDGNIVAMLGYQDGGFGASDFGFKVAQPGYSTDTATDDQLVMSSAFNSFKIVDKITLNLSIVHTTPSNSFGTTTVAHGLSSKPATVVYINVDPVLQAYGSGGLNDHPNPALVYGASGGFAVLFSVSEVTVDATNVTFNTQIGGGNASGTYVFSATVYLLKETAN